MEERILSPSEAENAQIDYLDKDVIKAVNETIIRRLRNGKLTLFLDNVFRNIESEKRVDISILCRLLEHSGWVTSTDKMQDRIYLSKPEITAESEQA
jgi:hypothetical protein